MVPLIFVPIFVYSSEDTLRAVVVTGGAGFQPAADSAALHRGAALSMADVLASGSTLFVKSYGRGTEATAAFRGAGPSHTLVTWNGVDIASPMLSWADFSYIPATFIDEATLRAGARSDAIGGEVALNSKVLIMNDDLAKSKLKTHHSQFATGAGSYHTFDEALCLRLPHSTTRAAYARSKNDFMYTNRDKMVDTPEGAYHPRERNQSGYFDDVNLMQDLAFGPLTASLWYTHSRRGLPFLSVDYKDNNTFKNEHRLDTYRATIAYERRLTRATLHARAAYTRERAHYDYSQRGTSIQDARSRAQTALLRLGAVYYIAPPLTLTFQADARYAHAASEDRSPYHIGQNYRRGRMEETFDVEARYKPYEKMTLTVKAKCNIQNAQCAFAPTLTADYQLLPWLRLEASGGRRHRFPSMNDLYYQPGGNPLLRPESGYTYDGGLAITTRYATLRVVAFDSYIRDWIRWTPSARGFWQPDNVSRVHNRGLESTLTAHYEAGRWRFQLLANYAFTPSTDAATHRQLEYTPRHTLNLTATIALRTWTLTYQWMHYSRRTTTDEPLLPYYMSNATIEKRFNFRRWGLNLKLQVNNLLDTEYITVLARPMPGRNVEGYVEVRF